MTSALRAAFDAAHSPLFDLVADAPSVMAMAEYRQRPEDFCVEVLGIARNTLRWELNPGFSPHAWDGTREPIIQLLEGLALGLDVGVEAGTGTQKSHTVAAAILWFLACWEGARSFTFAPKEDQLRLYIWKEIRLIWPRFQERFPQARLTDLCIRMRGGTDDSWGARGYAVGVGKEEQVATKAAGMHAPHMLLVYEEMQGIAAAVSEAGENTSTAPHNLRVAIGNPDHQLDSLHQFSHDQYGKVRPGVRAIRISALDHPNVVLNNADIVPGAASVKSVERRRAKYGTEGRLFRSRIRGISPAEAEEALIKLEWIHACQALWNDPETRKIMRQGKKALGVDVANSEGGDLAATSRWEGACLMEVPTYPCPNSNDFGFRVTLEMEEQFIDDANVGVDNVGVGAGAVNKMRERNHWIRALNSGEGANPWGGMDEEFNNLRSQMNWTLREDIRLCNIALPDDPELVVDLITPQWKTQNGKICIESKEDIKKRLGGRSPNKGDAVVYGNFVRDRTPIAEALKKRHPTAEQAIWKDALQLHDDEEDESAEGQEYGTAVDEG